MSTGTRISHLHRWGLGGLRAESCESFRVSIANRPVPAGGHQTTIILRTLLPAGTLDALWLKTPTSGGVCVLRCWWLLWLGSI